MVVFASLGSFITSALLVLIYITLLTFAIRYQFIAKRFGPCHKAPNVSAITALCSLLLGQIFEVARFGVGVTLVQQLFSLWADSFVILTVVFVLRDRYLTNKTHLSLPMSPILIVFGFLTGFMFILSTVFAALSFAVPFWDGGFPLEVSEPFIEWRDAEARASNVAYARLAIYVLTTILLIPLGIMVKKKMNANDKILNWTLRAIIPTLVIHSLLDIFFVTFEGLDGTFSAETNDFFFFLDIVFAGVAYIVTFGILAHFFRKPFYWNRPDQEGAQILKDTDSIALGKVDAQYGPSN